VLPLFIIKPKGKHLRIGFGRGLVSILVLVLCLVAVAPVPLLAFSLNLDDYFEYTIDVDFSKTEISGSEFFTATVTGTANCIADLPLTAIQAEITSRVVATHQVSGAEVTLNAGYSVTLADFPSVAGETTTASEVVSLRFPGGSEAGTYDVVGEVVDADVQFSLLGWLDVTSWLPSSQAMGTVTYEEEEGGGGGGGGGIVVEPDIGIQDYVDEDGVFTDDITAESGDGKCWIDVEEGTTGLDEDGDPLAELNVVEVDELPAISQDFPADVIGLAYDIGPDGATFDPPASLTLEYDELLVPEGVAEENLTIAMWDDAADEWVNLDGTVDVDDNTITVAISHLTEFAVLAYTRPAVFTASRLAITPDEVDIGTEIAITLLIANNGDLNGSYEVVLEIDDIEVETREVTLAGGSNVSVEFSIVPDAAGVHSVAVSGLSGTFEVRAAEVETAESGIPPAATFTVANLDISPDEVNAGDSVKISVTVINTGSQAGTHEVVLAIDGVPMATKEVTLAGGEGQLVTFTMTKGTAGTYQVDVAGLSASFVVREGASPLSPAAAPVNWIVLGGVAAAIVVVSLLVFFLVRRGRA